MRVLQANKFFYRRGGAEAVFFDTINGLRERGHEVAEFSMRHSNNLPSDYDKYFASPLPDLTGKKIGGAQMAKIFVRAISSSEIHKKLEQLIADFKPEVAHLHNVTKQLSASIFTTLKKLKIPIVLTVHDVQPMCPNHRMVRGDGRLCESCFKRRYYNCPRYSCVGNSIGKSLGAMVEAYYYYLRGIWDLVDVFVCPSQFMMDKMAEWGFPEGKMKVARNPHNVPAAIFPLGNKIVYLGRLHEEKGIKTFMRALPGLREYAVIIAGNGPEDEWVDKFIQEHRLTNVKKIGWVDGEARETVMKEAKVVVAPSLFYENCSLTILEAMAQGRIVVAADRGGNSELVRHGETGFLAEPENHELLALTIQEAMEISSTEAESIGAKARLQIINNHAPEKYFEELEEVYAGFNLAVLYSLPLQ